MNNLQYITEEAVTEFIEGMDEVTTESILGRPGKPTRYNGKFLGTVYRP